MQAAKSSQKERQYGQENSLLKKDWLLKFQYSK
jgi:hypothetical protein